MSRTEYDFMHDIKEKFDDINGIVVRIETGTTALGVPDMYVMVPALRYNKWTKHTFNQVIWIETKKVNRAYNGNRLLAVNWSSPQQRFATAYRMASTSRARGATVVRYTWTFVLLDTGVLLVPMYKYWPDNKVDMLDPAVIYITDKEWSEMSGEELAEILYENSVLIYTTLYDKDTLDDVALRIAKAYCYELYDKHESASPGLVNKVCIAIDEYFDDIERNDIVTHEWLNANEHDLATYIREIVCSYTNGERIKRP